MITILCVTQKPDTKDDVFRATISSTAAQVCYQLLNVYLHKVNITANGLLNTNTYYIYSTSCTSMKFLGPHKRSSPNKKIKINGWEFVSII